MKQSHHLIQVQYAISQWTLGQLVKGSQFTEAAYHDVYKRHLSSLDAWKALNSLSARALASHKARLYNNGLYVHILVTMACSLPSHPYSTHAGMAPATEAPKPCMTAGRLAHAAQSIQNEDLD